MLRTAVDSTTIKTTRRRSASSNATSSDRRRRFDFCLNDRQDRARQRSPRGDHLLQTDVKNDSDANGVGFRVVWSASPIARWKCSSVVFR